MGLKKQKSGCHPDFQSSHFTLEEQRILRNLAQEFYLTNGGRPLRLANSEYRYVLAKPTSDYEEMFNLHREIIFVFSPYTEIQARTLDAFDAAASKYSGPRVEKICNILISNDGKVTDSVTKLIKNEPEAQIVVPFSYNELSAIKDSNFIKNRFRDYFYTRDLFAFEAPLKKDIYFFGRSDLIQKLINRLKSHENAGLFGLRKTGKTSLINGIKRNLYRENIKPVIIDCQNTAFNQKRWYEALFFICERMAELFQIERPLKKDFSNTDASTAFEEFLKKCKSLSENEYPIILIFDEIENISRDTSPATHWKEGMDFVLFWQTLRSIFQNNKNLLSY
ncbi:ATP-binding protein, partial [Conchiformibius steedae]|uniref:ATP-binding protein n=1 Tax=Conchiformibius steedae TaxID=153493 RepID=UPI0026EB49D2